MAFPSSPAPQAPAEGSPRPAAAAERPARPAPALQLPIPYGVAKSLVFILVHSRCNPERAIQMAERWSGGTDDPRYAVIAAFIRECAEDPLIAKAAEIARQLDAEEAAAAAIAGQVPA